jgi:hypothetical protein
VKFQAGLLLLALVVASGPAVAVPPEDVAALKGQPVEPIIAILGAPDSEQKADNGTTYVWTVRTRVDTPTRTTRTDYSSGRPNTIETMAMRPQVQACTLTVVADGTGTITDADRRGPFQACAAVARKLSGERIGHREPQPLFLRLAPQCRGG